MIDLVIRNGKLVLPHGIVSGGVGIDDGVIVAISEDANLPQSDKIVDAEGNYVIPGIVDPEAHIRGRNFSFEEAIFSETRAAAASGVTTWGIQLTAAQLGLPTKGEYDSEDAVPLNSVLPSAIEAAGRSSLIDLFFTPAVETDQQVLEFPECADKYGITSFKMYGHCKRIDIASDFWIPRKVGLVAGFDDGTMYLALETVGKMGPPSIVCFHSENYEISRVLAERLKQAGTKDLAAWSDKSPGFVEAHQIRGYSYLAQITKATLYVMHVTTKETVEEIIRAKHDGVKIYGQTGPHYLSLTNSIGDGWKINVPLRDEDGIEYLWRALRDGLIDSLGSDHIIASFTRKEFDQMNEQLDIWSARSGFPSRVEATLPVMLSEGVNKGRISIQRLVQVCCENPAKIFGLYPKKGTISIGADADLVIFDMDKEVQLRDDMIHSASGWSIYAGREFKGWPIMTILRGNIIAEWRRGEPRVDVVGKAGYGKYLPRKLSSLVRQ